MPDPLLYLQALASAGLVSAILMIAIGMRTNRPAVRSMACIFAFGTGLAVGCYFLLIRPNWPPANALDRLLVIVVPALLLVEWCAAIPSVPPVLAWLFRIAVAITTPPILLHGSVYLSGSGDWTWVTAAALIVTSGLLLAGVWISLSALSQHSGGVSIPLSLCVAIQAAGMTISMAGYIKGGAAALAFAAALFGTLFGATIGCWLITTRREASNQDAEPAKFNAPAIVGIGVVSLFALLFIGRYFGRISTGMALTMLVAPLLCWTTEVPWFRDRHRWLVGSLRLLLVTIPLVVVLIRAKREFDREMSPLLVNTEAMPLRLHGIAKHSEIEVVGSGIRRGAPNRSF